MKTTILALMALFCLGPLAQAQGPQTQDAQKFSDALASFDMKALDAMALREEKDKIHRDLVRETIRIASRLEVRIDADAAPELDKIYVDASAELSGLPKDSEQWKQFPGNRTRSIALLIALAKSDSKGSLHVTHDTIEALKKTEQLRILRFCPCWPIC